MATSESISEKQKDELEAVSAIYEDALTLLKDVPPILSINIEENNLKISLELTLPPDYPDSSPPKFQLSAHWLRGYERTTIEAILGDTYAENMGESIIYLWVEKLREYLQSRKRRGSNDDGAVANISTATLQMKLEPVVKCPEIRHGETLSDRRSVFQPHLAPVVTEAEVRSVMSKLRENKKIADATHNIFAYRILQDSGGFMEGYEDDGEHGASKRMLHLMQKMNVENVLVVITRWYGGVHLGPDRFRHINGLAAEILEQCGYRRDEQKSPSKGKKHKKKS